MYMSPGPSTGGTAYYGVPETDSALGSGRGLGNLGGFLVINSLTRMYGKASKGMREI